MQDHNQFLQNRRSEIESSGLLTRDMLDFYLRLFDYQNKYYQRYKNHKLLNKINDELPLINSERIILHEDVVSMLTESLSEIITIAETFNPGMSLRALNENAIKKGYILDCIGSLLMKDPVKLESLTDKRLAVEEFIFIVVNWLKPFFVNIREAEGSDINLNDWIKSYCPVCGNYPDMTLILDSDGGKRILHCSLCECEWPYKRLSCSICGNEDGGSLGYFSEDETPYRIDYCDKCKGYIKTIRAGKFKKSSDFDLTVENLLTTRLDAAMLGKGYSRP